MTRVGEIRAALPVKDKVVQAEEFHALVIAAQNLVFERLDVEGAQTLSAIGDEQGVVIDEFGAIRHGVMFLVDVDINRFPVDNFLNLRLSDIDEPQYVVLKVHPFDQAASRDVADLLPFGLRVNEVIVCVRNRSCLSELALCFLVSSCLGA